MAKNPFILFIPGIMILVGFFLIIGAGQALIEATDNIWDDVVWSVFQFLLGEAVIIFVPIPAAGGIGIGLTAGGSIFLGKMN
ncbi:MAG: hypothetical protein ACFFAU_21345 [Candidatus Hodarchaeota archaeon]